jgi:hypothetical protein
LESRGYDGCQLWFCAFSRGLQGNMCRLDMTIVIAHVLIRCVRGCGVSSGLE